MRLAEFLLAKREAIIVEWEVFARSCSPAAGAMDLTALRDHAGEMLAVIAADLREPQSRFEQSEKSKGRAPADDDAGHAPATTAAERHGTGRSQSGFTVEQMVAEYRALRASVIRLWTTSVGALATRDIEDLTRFNEAIDQALAESVASFHEDVEAAKETFIAILGHDLRTPIGAIQTSAQFMLESDELQEPHRTLVGLIIGSAKRSITMVGDLLDFTRSRLGNGIPVTRSEMDLGQLVRDVVHELAAAYPGCPMQVDASADVRGEWDASRLTQVFGNLIGNAVQHGAQGTMVTVDVRATAEEATVAVHNRGAVIPPEQLDGIFNPMRARPLRRSTPARGPSGSLGLGLFIVERIVSAHDGRLTVESTAAHGTTFTVFLPRVVDTPTA